MSDHPFYKAVAALRAERESVEGPDRAIAQARLGRGLREAGVYAEAENELRAVTQDGDAAGTVRAAAAVDLAVLLACERERTGEARALVEGLAALGVAAPWNSVLQTMREALESLDRDGVDETVAADEPAWWPEFRRLDVDAAVQTSLGLMEVLALAGGLEAAKSWHARAEALVDDSDDFFLARLGRTSVLLLRLANAVEMPQAMPLAFSLLGSLQDLPTSHPLAGDLYVQAAIACADARQSAYAPVLADLAYRMQPNLDPAADRVRNETRQCWEQLGRPIGRDVGERLRALVLPGLGFGLYVLHDAPDGVPEIFSCVMRRSTGEDLLGALERGDDAWSNPNVGLAFERPETVRFTFSSQHEDSEDLSVELDEDSVAVLLSWAVEHGLSPRTFTSVGRNDACPCGSGKKFKRCHGAA